MGWRPRGGLAAAGTKVSHQEVMVDRRPGERGREESRWYPGSLLQDRMSTPPRCSVFFLREASVLA